MKRLVLALVLAMTLLPFTAFGLEMMSDSNMKDVTAQAGVAIVADDIVLVQHVGKTKYIDMDGTSISDTAEGAAAIVIGNRRRSQEINAVYGTAASSTEPSLRGIKFTYTTTEFQVGPLPLTIDVGKCVIMSYGLARLKGALRGRYTSEAAYTTEHGGAADRIYHMVYSEFDSTADATNVVGVQISLPTVEIYTAKDMYGISVELVESTGTNAGGFRSDATYHNNGREFISICREASGLAILGGRVEIAPK
jgi:hypothetical protein